MNRDQFNRMIIAAQDIARAADAGQTGLDPLTVEWAKTLLATNTLRTRQTWASPVRDRMLTFWDEDPTAGWTASRLAVVTERARKKVREMCGYLADTGVLFKLGDRGRGVAEPQYFLTARARDQARPAYEALTAKPPKAPRPPRKPKEKTVKKIKLARREPTPFNPTDGLTKPPPSKSRAVTAPAGPAYCPPHVMPIQCPSSTDTRYTPVLPPGGGEYAQEWKRLRGEA